MNPSWDTLERSRQARLERAAPWARGHQVAADDVHELLHALLEPGDKVCLEGNNQKQADFLAQALADLDPTRVHDLHMVQSVLSLPSHLDVFERGIASKLDFSFSGPQSVRLANLVAEGRIQIGAIHTYLELFGRYFIDLTPRVALVAAQAADRHGNLYTGPNTEDTPVIVEATAFGGGIVIAQVKRVAASGTFRPHDVRVPGILVDVIVEAPDQLQTTATPYDPAISGELFRPLETFRLPAFDVGKVIARRVAQELKADWAVNIGFGISANVPRILI